MKPSLDKLQKYFTLESERDYDNKAVMGGLESMLEPWQAEARADELPEDLIQAVAARLRDYARLSPDSRGEALKGLWARVRKQTGEGPPGQTDAKKVRETKSPPPKDRRKDTGPPNKSKPSPPPKPKTKKKRPRPEGPPAALDAAVTVLDGVGAKNAEKLAKLGVETLGDLLYHFPRRYDDYSQLKPINRLEYGEEVTVIASVKSIKVRAIRGGRSKITEAIIDDGTGALRVNWFNQPWLTNSIKEDDQIVFAGKIDQYLGRLLLTNPEWEPIEKEHLNTNRIVPVYPLTAKLTQRWLRGQMNTVIENWALRVDDYLPKSVRKAAELMDLPEALYQVHFPDSHQDLHDARNRLAFDEIFLLQLGVLRQKRSWEQRSARQFETKPEWLGELIDKLPYQLTAAQKKAVEQVRSDLASGNPMNLLLQGDVGSGKTVVAALAIAMVAEHGSQAAVLAPTSILAEQHMRSLSGFLAGESGMFSEGEIRLLIGATPEPEKQEIRQGLQDGSIKLVIGTHALLEDPVQFKDLQLAIIDEQHRFGVEQRAALRAKGEEIHLLVMTATPIPRSLALTVYGDLDLAVMDEIPPGRQPVSTHILLPQERERAYTLIRGQLTEGKQAFVVYPLVEESENSQSKAAVEEHATLQEEVFPNYRVALLHGRLKPDEKETVMEKFRAGEFDVLVSTTVVEVGVDVPNATVMLIDGANRFGLAQLHQLRGRVGRGEGKSYCLLVPESDDAIENERLKAMEESHDGFVLAEKDLEQRGPGQFLGTRQSGFSELRMASLSDVHLIEKARKQAQAFVEKYPELEQERHKLLAATLDNFWGAARGDIS
ncbi:MAG: ATP-dependent DNA helicase RecG [Anaerolineae bacterium]|nr:ATP-dependent DNA helicase RecG [Anaerolineae bacterium]